MYACPTDIKKHYHSNPYHNFRHAFDVCQMMYCFLTANKASDQLEVSLDSCYAWLPLRMDQRATVSRWK